MSGILKQCPPPSECGGGLLCLDNVHIFALLHTKDTHRFCSMGILSNKECRQERWWQWGGGKVRALHGHHFAKSTHWFAPHKETKGWDAMKKHIPPLERQQGILLALPPPPHHHHPPSPTHPSTTTSGGVEGVWVVKIQPLCPNQCVCVGGWGGAYVCQTVSYVFTSTCCTLYNSLWGNKLLNTPSSTPQLPPEALYQP